MARRISTAIAPARARVGLPVVRDGSRARPLLVRLAAREGEPAEGRCNNGCRECVTRPDDASATAVPGQHVVIRHREATLRGDLLRQIAALATRRPASLALITNGRVLLYPERARALRAAGLDRVIVKAFGLDAAAHDAHTRAPGSFDEMRAGIARAREAGLEAHLSFPFAVGSAAAREALARSLTGEAPVVLPEPEVEAHANEFRYDVVELRAHPGVAGPLWKKSFFPMVHVQTGPACNLRCTYCNVHGGDDQRLYAKEEIERLLDAAAEHVLRTHEGPGVPTVDFIGGEPTLHPELPALIRHARARGFEQVLICTNGVRLARPGVLDAYVAAGLTGVRFSFHDHRAAGAAELADVGGAIGPRYPEVARLLLSRPEVRTHFYRILLAPTLDAVPDYLRWLASHNRLGRPIDLTFGLPSMRGRMFENPALHPPLDGLRERVAEAVALALELGIEPIVHHAPACVVPHAPERAACLHIETQQRDALDGRVSVTDFEGDARHGDACQRCRGLGDGCHGVPATYWERDPAATEAWLTPLSS